jgi:4-hydroxy-tetrahydrodipicolinate reductase
MKRVKVAQFGLGAIGLESLRLAAEQPWMEIVGAVDNDPEKYGRSLVELTGLGSLDGLSLCPTLEELFRETQPEVILHTTSSSAAATLQQIRPALELGLAVASTCEELIYPALQSPELARELNALCLHTKTRLVATGVNPGFVMDLLPICLTGVCRAVDHIRAERVVDASTGRQPLQAKIGCGQDPVIAEKNLRIRFFDVAASRTCGIHQRATGTAAGRGKIALEIKMYLEAPAPCDAIRITGRPDLEVTINGGVAGEDATIASLINVVPRLLAAPPGLRLLSELATPAWTGGLT